MRVVKFENDNDAILHLSVNELALILEASGHSMWPTPGQEYSLEQLENLNEIGVLAKDLKKAVFNYLGKNIAISK